MIRAVYLDIGETVLDRTREYAAWASWLGAPAHTFSAVFGALVAQGRPVRDVIAHFRPEPDFATQRRAMTAAGLTPVLAEQDLYLDARQALEQVKQTGVRVGLVGNQPLGIAAELRALRLAADVVATSADWRVAKPSPGFFARIIQDAGCRADEIVYVGDQLDKDVVPALEAGLRPVRILRGPWGHLTRDAALEARCLAVITSLAELPALVASAGGRVASAGGQVASAGGQGQPGEERPDQGRG